MVMTIMHGRKRYFPPVALLALVLCVGAGAARGEEEAAAPPKAAATESPPAVKAGPVEDDSVAGKREKPPPGWKEVRSAGVLYWCRTYQSTGSRVHPEVECATPDQLRERRESDRKQTEEMLKTGPSPKSN
jgi:hypothetical protein